MSQFNGNAADLDMNFTRNLFTNDINVLEGEAAIRRALKNLVLMKSGDKPFHPEINTGITELLFENVDTLIIEELKTRIRNAIYRYEPRVSAARVDVQYNIDRNAFQVKVLYTIRNVQKTFNTTFVLERTR